MLQWVRKGLSTGIMTTPYPDGEDTSPGLSPGLPLAGPHPRPDAQTLAAVCPTGALSERDQRVELDAARCIHCFRCARQVAHPLPWQGGWEWAYDGGREDRLGKSFQHSAHVLIVDAGDCGACLREVKQLNNPYYNMHRLGIFLVPSPRHADVLLVVGPVTDAMRVALQKAYDAMPTPRCVVAVGACALSGGIFGSNFACEGGVARVLPVDVEVPGHPPPPLAILHGLLVALKRRPPSTRDVSAEERIG